MESFQIQTVKNEVTWTIPDRAQTSPVEAEMIFWLTWTSSDKGWTSSVKAVWLRRVNPD
jgi:hypothetical protein